MEDYGRRIKEARERAGMTQEELGKAIGVTGVTIMRYERGQRQPRFKQMERIADALDVPVMDLMGLGSTVQSAQAAENVLAAFKDICSMVLRDDRVPTDLKAEVRRKMPVEPELALNALTWHAGEALGVLEAFQAVIDENVAWFNGYMSVLNEEGQKKALERVQELTEIERYRNPNTQDVIEVHKDA